MCVGSGGIYVCYVRVAGYSFTYVCYYACFQGRSVAKTVPSVSRTTGSVMAWVTAMICLTRATAVSNCLLQVGCDDKRELQ